MKVGGIGSEKQFARASNLSVSQIVDAFRRRWKLFVATALLVTAFCLGVTLLLTPVWTARSVIQIEPNRRQPTDLVNVVQGGPPDQAVVDTEVNLMRSREVIRGVVSRLKLQNDPEFFKADANRAMTPETKLEATIDGVLQHLDIERQGETYLVGIAARSQDRVKAAMVANAVAAEYQRFTVEGRSATATEASDQLRRQLSGLADDVRAADASVAQYRASQGIVSGTAAGTITDQQVAPLSSQLATAEAQAAAAVARYNSARSQIASGGLDSVSGVLSSGVIADLRRQRAEVLRNVGEARSRYGPRHPETLALQQQLEDLDRQLREEGRRVVSGLEGDARAASASAASLRNELSRLRSRQATETQASVAAESLERDAEAKRVMYNQLAQAVQQTSQQRQTTASIGRVVQAAEPPQSPSFPNRPLFAVLGAFLGILAGLAVVIAAENIDTAVRTANDLEQHLGIAHVASVPRLTSRRLKHIHEGARPWDYVLERPMSRFTESLRSIRSAIGMLPGGDQARIIAISSALPGEGKTSLTSSLARLHAMSGDRTLLIDCDLRRRSLSRTIDTMPAAGIVEVLEGRAQLADAITSDPKTGLDILPALPESSQPKDVFGGGAFSRLLEDVRQRYDVVLIDTAPILAVADTRTIASRVDAVLLLVSYNSTSRFAVRGALKRMEQANAVLMGAVLSLVDERSLGQADETYSGGAYSDYYQD